MAYLYEVHTNVGVHQVPVDHHHDHISRADFERIVLQAVANATGQVVSALILHRVFPKSHG